MSDSRSFGSHADVLPIGQSAVHADAGVDLSQHVFQMRVADAGTPAGARPTQQREQHEATQTATAITTDGKSQLTPAQAEFERLMSAIKEHPDQYNSNLPAIDRMLAQADTRFYKTLEEGMQAIKKFEPGYDKAAGDLQAGYRVARVALRHLPPDQRSQAVGDAERYIDHPTEESKQRLLALGPAGQDLAAAAHTIATAVRNPDYVAGEQVRKQMDNAMQDSIGFREIYGHVLADDLQKMGPALGVIWQEKHMMREVAEGRRLGPGE